MAEVDKDAKTIELGNDLLAKLAYAAMGGTALGTVADIVVAIMAEGHIYYASFSKMAELVKTTLYGKTVFNAFHY